MTSVLARQQGWADGAAGWPTEAAAPEATWSDAAPEDGFVVTDGYPAAAGCTSCGGHGCERCCHPSGVVNRLCDTAACPRWVVQVDALMLWQGNIASRPLFSVYDVETATIGATALNANQAQTEMSAGPRVAAFYNLDQTFAIEGNYFNVRPFNGEALAKPGQVLVERDLAGFGDEGFDGAQVFTTGAIQSAELNWRRRECWCPVTWLAGFRWVEWNQQMRIIEYLEGPYGEYLSKVGNDLYGGQIGMDLGLWNGGGPFTVIGTGKAGIFYNRAFQHTTYEDAERDVAAGAAADQTSFFGEVGINASLQITKWLSWRVGYVLFWIDGVAVPAEQLSTTNLNEADPPIGATINTNGGVFLQGATTGLEARW